MDAEAQAVLATAEADAQARTLRSEAETAALRAELAVIGEALGKTPGAVHYLAARTQSEAWTRLAGSPQTRLILAPPEGLPQLGALPMLQAAGSVARDAQ